MDPLFDNFVTNDLSLENLNTIENLYLLIGTYPTLLNDSIYPNKYAPILQSLLFKLAFQKIIVLLNKETREIHSYNVNNSVFYFIDQYYDDSYKLMLCEMYNIVYYDCVYIIIDVDVYIYLV